GTYSPASCTTNGIGFYNDRPTLPGGTTDPHGSLGGLVQIPGFADVVTTIKDPAQIYSGGVGWLNNATGAYTKGYEVLPPGPQIGSIWINGSKAAGMGDMEALCNEAPLEVGNRVWKDLNGNGVQDAGEPPLANVTVNLYAPGGSTPIATAVTDTNGNYYFSNKSTDENGNALTQTNGGATVNAISGLLPNTNGFAICLDNAANYAAGGPLSGLGLTLANSSAAGGDTSNSGLTDLLDSDAQIGTTGAPAACATRPSIVFNTQASGQNNFGLDVGFTSYSLGNRVWFDANNNGLVDGSEAGVDNVVVELLVEDSPGSGNFVPTPTPTTLTTANGGYYRFDGLAAGNYRVRVNASNFAAGAPLRGYFTSGTPVADPNGDINNDNNGLAPTGGNYVGLGVTSGTVTLGGATPEPTTDNTEAGTVGANTYNSTNSNGTAAPDNQTNMSLDFGFHKVSIGNRVWLDTGTGAGQANNGIFDSGEANVADGTTVTLVDNLGNVIATTTTSGGTYMFMTTTAGNPLLVSGEPASLAQQFRVVVSPPAGYTSSTPTFPVAAGNDERDHGTPTVTGGNVQSPNFTFSSLGTNANGQVPDAAAATTAQPQIDFGLVPTFSLGNRVWFDANNNGLVDGSEEGVNGVVVELLTETSPGSGSFTPSGTTLTTANGGYYRFDGLSAGNYQVRVNPSNFAAAGPLRGYFTSGTPTADANGDANNDN
ncbi:MAG: SdrD B-like domain-containing protein, partial [Casimicrobium sp.]